VAKRGMETKSELMMLANEIGFELTNEKTDYSKMKCGAYVELDFNDLWNNKFSTNGRAAKIIDTSMEPPAGFSFFYYESPYKYAVNTAQTIIGRLQVSCGSDLFDMDVPFTLAKAGVEGLSGQIFNIRTLLATKVPSNSSYAKFAGNFCVFTGAYGHYYQNELKIMC
jgi:hypothetical protein